MRGRDGGHGGGHDEAIIGPAEGIPANGEYNDSTRLLITLIDYLHS